MSVRNSKKADKRQRIFSAARDRFEKDGFEATTIRSVATDAKVAVGTVLLHTTSKQDLLQAVWREEMMPVVQEAISGSQSRQGVEGLLALFSPLLRAYSQKPALARVVVQQLPWLDGVASEVHRRDLDLFLAAISEVLSRSTAVREGREDLQLTAELLFAAYYSACWQLLRPVDPTPLEQTLERLRRQVEVVLRGVQG